jgi:hypothetical protein
MGDVRLFVVVKKSMALRTFDKDRFLDEYLQLAHDSAPIQTEYL